MKIIVFDTGPVISLALNNLLWLLGPLKKQFDGSFYITESIKNELIDRPIESKKFKLEAMQVYKRIKKGILQIHKDEDIKEETYELLQCANHIFSANGNWLTIVHRAEVEGIVLAKKIKADAFVVDERTTRMLIEEPTALKKLLESRLHKKIKVNKDNLNYFTNYTKDIKILRSTELVTVAFDMNLLEEYLPDIKEPKKELLQGLLWGVKLRGCAISQREIDEIVKIEIK